MSMAMTSARGITPDVARINGVPLHTQDAAPPLDELRQRACTELLRQAAQRAGLLTTDDAASPDGVISEAAANAIESLLDQVVNTPEPSEEACERHYAAHKATYQTGERLLARHILFAVTPGVDVVALRKRAETTLLEVRCHDGGTDDRFVNAARTSSNCPSGEQGGDLGWLSAADCAPEFARELFGHAEVGVLPRLVHSRFGLHVIEVLAREPGVVQSFAAVRGAVTLSLRQLAYVTALRQCLRLLASEAEVQGVDLDAADTPLVQ
jgi:peptidyl-prolyl cis-trans isomerase C